MNVNNESTLSTPKYLTFRNSWKIPKCVSRDFLPVTWIFGVSSPLFTFSPEFCLEWTSLSSQPVRRGSGRGSRFLTLVY